MLGSAAVSLVNVAKGSIDVYSEKNIMLWDVAAGLAIIQGAGGGIHFTHKTTKHSPDVYTSNGIRNVFPTAILNFLKTLEE